MLIPIDMNDSSNLELYSRLLLFKNDVFHHEILWQNPDNALQRALQSLAHKLDLEYEYSLRSRVVRISRPTVSDIQMDADARELEFANFGYHEEGHNLCSHGLFRTDHPLHGATSSGPSYQHAALTNPPVTVAESSMMSVDLPQWCFDTTLVSNDFGEDDNPVFSPAESRTQNLNYSTNDFLPMHSLSDQLSQSQSPSSTVMDRNENSSELDLNHEFPPPFLTNEWGLQTVQPRKLSLPTKTLDSVVTASADSSPADLEMDEDDSEVSTKPRKPQRFYCTDYPPCELSFTRSEHLARHIR
jgi:hypothetical protein